MPAIAKILIVFVSMLALTRVRVPLSLALVLGGVVLSLWAGAAPLEALTSLGDALAGAELWLFLVITVMIIEIGRYITDGRNADDILAATQRWGGRHGATFTLMGLPAVIGLIPMPAGALFSAPFVHQAGSRINGESGWKSAINYWFRHIWEYWWPLYPGVIVAMSVFEMDAWQFMAVEIPYTPVAVAAGYFFLVRPHVARLSETTESGEGSNRRALLLFLPLVVVVVTLFIAPVFLVRFAPEMGVQSRKLTALLIGLFLALAIIVRDEWRTAHSGGGTTSVSSPGPDGAGPSRERRIRLFSTLLSKKSRDVLFTLGGVLVFKAMLAQTGLLPLASDELVQSGIPITLAVAALPFLAGLITGLALGFTGTSFPLVVGLMAAEGSGLTPLATLVLAYGWGYMGMMLSPVHLCFLVTRDYFSASFWSVYRLILPCVVVVGVYGTVAHLVLRALGW